MKEGDYIICKKDKYDYQWKNGNYVGSTTYYRKGKSYKIKDIMESLYYINIEDEFGVGKTFSFEDKLQSPIWYLYEFFYTKEEIRDININKTLNNNEYCFFKN